MFDYDTHDLARYIRTLMDDHGFRSERAFALHTGVSPRTLGRILDGTKVDPESLLRIAQALHLPVENLYRLAGYLPPEEDRSRLLREVEYLLRDLPEAIGHLALARRSLGQPAEAQGLGQPDRLGHGLLDQGVASRALELDRYADVLAFGGHIGQSKT